MKIIILISQVLTFIITLVSALNVDVNELANELRHSIKGQVFVKGTHGYNNYRAVHNGACRHIYPALIARPLNTYDVSNIVKIANKYKIEISVRSGGHSYQCQGTKQYSLNIDLRQMNKVQVISPYEALLGELRIEADTAVSAYNKSVLRREDSKLTFWT